VAKIKRLSEPFGREKQPLSNTMNITHYPRSLSDHGVSNDTIYWVGNKNWSRFTPSQKAQFNKLRREKRHFTLTWETGRTHPIITLSQTNTPKGTNDQ
jgi:hypothetical protein